MCLQWKNTAEEKESEVGYTWITTWDAVVFGTSCELPIRTFEDKRILEIGRHVNVIKQSEQCWGLVVLAGRRANACCGKQHPRGDAEKAAY